MLINIMLNVNMLIVERNLAECQYDECDYAECHYSECHYAFIINLTIFSFYSRRARSHTD